MNMKMNVKYEDGGRIVFHCDDIMVTAADIKQGRSALVARLSATNGAGSLCPPSNIDIRNREQRHRLLADLAVAHCQTRLGYHPHVGL